jgi:hypothetical protein
MIGAGEKTVIALIAGQSPRVGCSNVSTVPLAAAAEPPIEEASMNPDQPDHVRFIAGSIHETLDLDAHRDLLGRIEEKDGRELDVAAACGLG